MDNIDDSALGCCVRLLMPASHRYLKIVSVRCVTVTVEDPSFDFSFLANPAAEGNVKC